MKLRNGFVSNSSSTSFCIFGCSIKQKDYDRLDQIKNKGNLELYCWPDAELYWIGRSFTSIKDDETGKQFKETVEKEISDLFGGRQISCSVIEESWYDG